MFIFIRGVKKETALLPLCAQPPKIGPGLNKPINTGFIGVCQHMSTFENKYVLKMSPVSTFEKQKSIKMLRMPAFGELISRIIFPVSTAIDKYKE